MADSQEKGQGLLPGTMLARGFRDPASIRWPVVAVRDIFGLKYGKALVDAHRPPGSVPVYGTNGRCGYHDTALFRGPGVILGRKGQGPLGVEWCEVDYWVIDITIEEIRQHGHVLTPGRYVGAEAQEDNGEPFAEKMRRLVAQWREQQAETRKLDEAIWKNLKGLGYDA